MSSGLEPAARWQGIVSILPIYKEKQETDQRFSSIETSIQEMKGVIENQNKMMGQLMEKLLSKT